MCSADPGLGAAQKWEPVQGRQRACIEQPNRWAVCCLLLKVFWDFVQES